MFLDPIYIQFLEVAFCLKKSNFIQTALRDLTKKAQFLSKHVMRDLGVLSGVLQVTGTTCNLHLFGCDM